MIYTPSWEGAMGSTLEIEPIGEIIAAEVVGAGAALPCLPTSSRIVHRPTVVCDEAIA